MHRNCCGAAALLSVRVPRRRWLATVTGLPHRHSIRLRGYDYSLEGAYFVTIVTEGRACLFGDVHGDAVCLNEAGRIAEEVCRATEAHCAGLCVDSLVVMPNHVHVLVALAPGSSCMAARNPGRTDGAGEGRETPPLRYSPHVRPASRALPACAPADGAAAAPARTSGTRASSAGAGSPRPPGHHGAEPDAAHPTLSRPTLGQVIAYYKYLSTKRLTALYGWQPTRLWQRNYYERIIRSQREYDAACCYVADNPARWADDAENPER